MTKIIKCVVTGGAGFIGSHLVDLLLVKGYEVYCLDNLLTGSEANISHLKSNPLFHFLNTDVTRPDVILKCHKFGPISRIYHLASPASPPFYRKYSIETLLVNSLGTKNMLDLAILEKAKFLFASTSEVYGDPLLHPQKETYFGNVNPIGVRACYDEAKRFGEALIMEYIRKYDVNARIIRIFNTYGPRMQSDDGRVIVNFVNQALTHKALVIYGNGGITRSFCYVSDMVEGILKAMEKPDTKTEVINLGFPKEHTIREIADIIIMITGSKSVVRKGKRQEDDPQRRRPDITKAVRLLNWQPRVNLEAGIEKTVKYFQNL